MRVTHRRKSILVFSILVLLSGLVILSSTSSARQPENIRPEVEYREPGNELETDQEQCLVPCDEIINGGPGRDGIPSIDDPSFYSVTEAEADMEDNDVVIGVEVNGQMRAYPYKILNWHEIANVNIDGIVMSITYCPLTGTGILYKTGNLGGAELGTTGRLFENNLVFYDRISESYWSQMYGLAVMGDRMGETLDIGETIETTWKALKTMYPDAQVLTRDTGIYGESRYDQYPYDRYNYLESSAILFPSRYDGDKSPDDKYHPKALTTIVIDDHGAKLLPFAELDTDIPATGIYNDQLFSVFFESEFRLSVPFSVNFEGDVLELRRVDPNDFSFEDSFGMSVYQDQFDNVWNMKGEAIAGDALGKELIRVPSYNGFWFAAMAFFPNASLYENGIFTSLTGTINTGEFTGEVPQRTLPLSFSPALLLVTILMVRRFRRRE